MLMDQKAFDDLNVRLALKYALDREEVVKTVLSGFGLVRNDHPISPNDPFCNTSLPQYAYDPDKARFYAEKAGSVRPN